MVTQLILCETTETPGTRDDCENSVHDYPLPNNFVAAEELATKRLRYGWKQPRCPRCKRYGWAKGRTW